MKKKLFSALLLVILIFAALPVGIWAIGPYPPTLTLIVYGAPKDTQMHVVLQNDGEPLSCPMERERRGWETWFRLYRDGVSIYTNWRGNVRDFEGAELVLTNAQEEKRVPIPDGLLAPHGYNEILSLKYSTGEISYGFLPWRKPLLVGMRVLAALLIEGIFFRLSGYTTRKSWLLFLAINVVIHGALNSLCYGQFNLAGYVPSVAYFTAILLSFLAELCAFVLLVDEYDRDRLSRCLIMANVVSHAVNYLLITYLPL